MDQDIKSLTDTIATSTLQIFKTEKANKFFRIGFFVLLILFSASIALTIYTRFTPKPDSKLLEQVETQQDLINNLTKINEEQKINILNLEENSQLQEQSINNAERILASSVTEVNNAKTANEKAKIALQTLLQIAQELRRQN
jgi:hypothetical protein